MESHEGFTRRALYGVRQQHLILLCFFQATGLHFRHTDNVIQWLNAMDEIGLPKVTYLVFMLLVVLKNNSSHSACKLFCIPTGHLSILPSLPALLPPSLYTFLHCF